MRRRRSIASRCRGHAVVLLLALAVPALVTGGAGASAESPSYRDEVLADSPIGYWRLGETSGTRAFDQTPTATNGVYQGGTVLRVPGALSTDTDTAAGFDGGNDQVSMGDPASGSMDVGTGDFSVEAWVKAPLTGTERGLFGKRDAQAYWIVNVTDDSGHVGQLRAITFDGTVTRSVYSLHRIDDGLWHHLVVGFDRDSGIRFWVDGVNSGFTVAPTPGPLDNTGPLLIGKSGGYPHFKGEIDDVSLYKTLLTQQRVQAHRYASLLDSTAPSVTLASPTDGSSTSDTTPTFAGMAGTALGDSASVTVSVHAGADASGAVVGTVLASPDAAGSYSGDASAPLPLGTYTAQAAQTDGRGNTGRSAATTFTIVDGPPPPPPPPPAPPPAPVLVGQGISRRAERAAVTRPPRP